MVEGEKQIEDLMVKHLLSSKEERNVLVARRIVSRRFLKGLDTRKMCLGLAKGSEEDIAQVNELLKSIVNTPNMGPKAYSVMISVIESNLSNTNRIGAARSGSRWLRRAIEKETEATRKPIAKMLDALDKRIETIGQKCEFTTKDMFSQDVSNKDLIGNPTVYIFWASRSQADVLKPLTYYESYADEGIQFVVVPMDREAAETLLTIKQRYSFVTILKHDPEGLQKSMNVTFIPYIAMSDSDGKIERMNIHPDMLRTILNEVCNSFKSDDDKIEADADASGQ